MGAVRVDQFRECWCGGLAFPIAWEEPDLFDSGGRDRVAWLCEACGTLVDKRSTVKPAIAFSAA
jgi:hypothetical protein